MVAMTEFTKTKMHFTLALLGTLFALHPFVEKIEDWGFDYGVGEYQVKLKVFYVYALIAGLLALTVYCFALSLRSEHTSSWVEKLGNYAYGLAIMVLPLYGGFYLAHWLAEELVETEWSWAVKIAPMVPLALGAFWLLLSQVIAFWVNRRLSDQDRQAKIDQLAQQELAALNRAPEMFDGDHYDLAVIESWKALEARLRRALLLHRHANPGEKPEAVVAAAVKTGVLSPAMRGPVEELRRNWHIAIGTEPSSREAAEKALKTTRDVLATIPVVDMNIIRRPA
jgi:MFS family permease